MLYWKVDVLKELKDKGYNTTRILKENIVGQSSMTKIRQGEVIGIIGIEKLCHLLGVQPGDLIGYKEEP